MGRLTVSGTSGGIYDAIIALHLVYPYDNRLVGTLYYLEVYIFFHLNHFDLL